MRRARLNQTGAMETLDLLHFRKWRARADGDRLDVANIDIAQFGRTDELKSMASVRAEH